METIQFNSSRWIRIALINFLIVALAGVILRYKINFPLPFINQKFLLHGHSHFAFVGWVTLALIAMMVNYLIRSDVVTNYRKYHWLLIANTLTAYGMLFAFIFQGYALLSITFSTLSIFVSYFFIYHYWKDLNKIKQEGHITIWFKSALILLGISSIGAFGLAYLMASRTVIQELYFAAIYFFLHFQYNGWFIFSSFGLLFSFLKERNKPHFIKINKHLFLTLAIAVVPSYLLSIFGLKIPDYLFWIGTISAIIQLAALFYSYKLLQAIQKSLSIQFTKMTALLWSLAYISFVLKIILQTLSIIPYFSSFAFGLRPVIIGYLHLCFLCVISFFILGYINELLTRKGIKLNKSGLLIFIFGVILQEVVLMIQALDAMMNKTSANTHIVLLIAAIAMASGLAMLVKTKRLKSI
ncbi:hypothetical protein SAMN04487898_10136 [Pedobacter sp. ok626]|uniref:hypothetical protein n=1 Tax=Pedobacter sp. ok626 TaxID=1761882 RepID=UPI0008892CBF|nr:hypothetical protein [Pedobacter sp. ok626]SDI99863.1 hypothetical protein SAMN04487898_10136 [Pedobacter sp. ok626]